MLNLISTQIAEHGILRSDLASVFPQRLCNKRTWLNFKVAADMMCAGRGSGLVAGCAVCENNCLAHLSKTRECRPIVCD